MFQPPPPTYSMALLCMTKGMCISVHNFTYISMQCQPYFGSPYVIQSQQRASITGGCQPMRVVTCKPSNTQCQSPYMLVVEIKTLLVEILNHPLHTSKCMEFHIQWNKCYLQPDDTSRGIVCHFSNGCVMVTYLQTPQNLLCNKISNFLHQQKNTIQE